MNRALIVAIWVVCTLPLTGRLSSRFMAKLKADAQKVVSIIKADKAKVQAYCQINKLADQIRQD